eukprot:1137624-Pelagomonas_calceolata.AAC.1
MARAPCALDLRDHLLALVCARASHMPAVISAEIVQQEFLVVPCLLIFEAWQRRKQVTPGNKFMEPISSVTSRLACGCDFEELFVPPGVLQVLFAQKKG